ncbi:MAG: DNA mismatch repair endonuclease MutL [Phycisphaerae bacterium]|nr:MAG: DNA mismatch repair endonuclease MutL [Planctomycetota bacterium]MBE7455251.1 DNA mismatch repair endonuclease MutL [Planctomycetia bacterium]MCK6464064.1 DNA mismatch repair endonuclease MutL [Phycisphaerae bacterium]MCL4717763.1 DNA mismatch repair endonuclease MutL [Phycisphaerae bacterium]MCQ3919810.1 DNA mismatch repair endonuclease MutL [Planctomycetota bacterium]
MSSANRIRVLPPLLVSQIAAGEVIERPASVVKELLDNALDAGSAEPLPGPLEITVVVEKGGTELIRVTDNAGGMSPDELELAVRAHATSKLADEQDLYRIATLGFRGEALASIGAVSSLRIVSRRRESAGGHEVRVCGSTLERAQAAAAAPGTTVEVRDLFHNVPARRKFLKAPATETGHVTEVFVRAALAFPDVGFRMISGARTTYDLPPASGPVDRIRRLFGDELAGVLLATDRRERGLNLQIFAAPPAHSRATGTWQYFFVNGRYIRDRFLQHAVKEAYRGLIEPSRFPVVFVFITIDPEMIDVNVHPTKIEVRWAEPNLVHSQVLSALRELLQRADLTPGLRTDRARPNVDAAEQDRIRREFASLLLSQPPLIRVGGSGETLVGGGGAGKPEGFVRGGSLSGESTVAQAAVVWRSLYDARSGGIPEAPTNAGGQDARLLGGDAGSAERVPDRQRGEGPGTSRGSGLRAIQLHNTYIVVESDDGLLIIDQHALHERIMYEHLRQRIMSAALESQRLLLPETIPASAADLAAVEARADLLERLGIDAGAFGADRIAVHAFPSLMKDTDVPQFMRDLLDRLQRQGDQEHPEALIHDVLDMMACKAAVKAGDPLTAEEINTLVAHKDLVERSSNCPHGRPTTLRLTKSDLERQFKRT